MYQGIYLRTTRKSMRNRTEEQKRKIAGPPPKKLPLVLYNRVDDWRRSRMRTREYPTHNDKDSCR